jgi:hypothetical protein
MCRVKTLQYATYALSQVNTVTLWNVTLYTLMMHVCACRLYSTAVVAVSSCITQCNILLGIVVEVFAGVDITTQQVAAFVHALLSRDAVLAHTAVTTVTVGRHSCHFSY